MLGDSKATAVVPTHDINTSRPFYEDKLGLKVIEELAFNAVIFEAGGGSELLLYETRVAVPAEHTVCSFEVADIRTTVTDLESRGVTFEEYDLEEFGYPEAGKGKIIEAPDGMATAWFKDPEGNILALGQR